MKSECYEVSAFTYFSTLIRWLTQKPQNVEFIKLYGKNFEFLVCPEVSGRGFPPSNWSHPPPLRIAPSYATAEQYWAKVQHNSFIFSVLFIFSQIVSVTIKCYGLWRNYCKLIPSRLSYKIRTNYWTVFKLLYLTITPYTMLPLVYNGISSLDLRLNGDGELGIEHEVRLEPKRIPRRTAHDVRLKRLTACLLYTSRCV